VRASLSGALANRPSAQSWAFWPCEFKIKVPNRRSASPFITAWGRTVLHLFLRWSAEQPISAARPLLREPE
jgi:hypothetical protein